MGVLPPMRPTSRILPWGVSGTAAFCFGILRDNTSVSSAGRGEVAVPRPSAQAEASDNLLEVLRGASIDEEHRTLMSTVIEKVRSAKSGLTEAYTSLLTGFEVSNEKHEKISPDGQ